jgi:hypothetical protein
MLFTTGKRLASTLSQRDKFTIVMMSSKMVILKVLSKQLKKKRLNSFQSPLDSTLTQNTIPLAS